MDNIKKKQTERIYKTPPLIKPKKKGRNEPCPCGSGKNYKKCCMVKQAKRLTRKGFELCFKKLVKDAGGSIDIKCLDLDLLPKDECLAIAYNAEDDYFHFEVVKFKKSNIITRDKRIIL